MIVFREIGDFLKTIFHVEVFQDIRRERDVYFTL